MAGVGLSAGPPLSCLTHILCSRRAGPAPPRYRSRNSEKAPEGPGTAAGEIRSGSALL